MDDYQNSPKWSDVAIALDDSTKIFKHSRSITKNVRFNQKLVRFDKSPKKNKRAKRILVGKFLPYCWFNS
jgi:hypothetical protein